MSLSRPHCGRWRGSEPRLESMDWPAGPSGSPVRSGPVDEPAIDIHLDGRAEVVKLASPTPRRHRDTPLPLESLLGPAFCLNDPRQDADCAPTPTQLSWMGLEPDP